MSLILIFQVFFLDEPGTTSYAGHAFGALAGLTIGIFVLENRKVEDWEKKFEWMVLILFAVILLLCVGWHIVGTPLGYFPSEQY